MTACSKFTLNLFNSQGESLYHKSGAISNCRTRCSNATDTFECMVDVDEAILQSANSVINNSGFFGTFVLVPVIDGEFIKTSPTKQITSGRLNGVSVSHSHLHLFAQ